METTLTQQNKGVGTLVFWLTLWFALVLGAAVMSVYITYTQRMNHYKELHLLKDGKELLHTGE